MYKKKRLENGLTLITVPTSGTKALTALALFGVGSRYEKSNQRGLSHFIEHMMFKGTARRPTTLDLSRVLDSVGAEYNAFTARDHTGYYIKVDSRHADLALDVLADMLTHSKFEKEEIEKEKGVIIEEINMYEDNPTMDVEQLCEEILFSNHPLGEYIAGQIKSVKKFNRPQLLAHYNHFYEAQNGAVVLAGHIPPAVEKASKYFLNLKKGRGAARRDFSLFKFGLSSGSRFKIKRKETDQTHLALGWPAFSYDDRRSPALTLLDLILGGTMSSRLFIEVRERRGLAYMICSSHNHYHEIGSLLIQAGLDKKRVQEAVRVILSEVEKIKRIGVTEEELERAKENLTGHLVLSLENSTSQAVWYAKQAILMKQMETPEQKLKKIRAVKSEEVRKIAAEIFDLKKMRLSVIGSYNQEQEIRKWLT